MAKLFEVTAILNNQVIRYNPVSTFYLNPKNVEKVVSTTYINNSNVSAIGSQINYTGFDGTFVDQIVATEPPSTVSTRMNAANTTDVYKIDLTVIDPFAPATGYIAQSYKTAVSVNVEDIWLVMKHPLNNANAYICLQNHTRSNIDSARVEQAASAIAAAANA
jgi:hypothetical protein